MKLNDSLAILLTDTLCYRKDTIELIKNLYNENYIIIHSYGDLLIKKYERYFNDGTLENDVNKRKCIAIIKSTEDNELIKNKLFSILKFKYPNLWNIVNNTWDCKFQIDLIEGVAYAEGNSIDYGLIINGYNLNILIMCYMMYLNSKNNNSQHFLYDIFLNLVNNYFEFRIQMPAREYEEIKLKNTFINNETLYNLYKNYFRKVRTIDYYINRIRSRTADINNECDFANLVVLNVVHPIISNNSLDPLSVMGGNNINNITKKDNVIIFSAIDKLCQMKTIRTREYFSKNEFLCVIYFYNLVINNIIKNYNSNKSFYWSDNNKIDITTSDELNNEIKNIKVYKSEVEKDLDCYKNKNKELIKENKEKDNYIKELENKNKHLLKELEEEEELLLSLDTTSETEESDFLKGDIIHSDFNIVSPTTKSKTIDEYIKLYDVIVNKKIIIVGGPTFWQEKIREKFPNFIFIDGLKQSSNLKHLKNSDCIIMNVDALKHSVAIKVRYIIKKYGKNHFYVNINNIDDTLSIFEEQLPNQLS